MKVFFFNFLFTHLTMLSLHCTQIFSSCCEQGLLSTCSAQASNCGGFSCCGAHAVECGLSSHDKWAYFVPWHVESSCTRNQTHVPCIGLTTGAPWKSNNMKVWATWWWWYSVTQLCPTFCKPMHCSMPGFPVLYHLLELPKLMSIDLAHA